MPRNPQIFLQFQKRQAKKFLIFNKRAISSVFHETDIVYVSKKIAKMIGDREAAIKIAIGDPFLNGKRDRDRDRDPNF